MALPSSGSRSLAKNCHGVLAHKLSIVLIEHDMRVVFHLADRIMVLTGRVLAEGTPPEIAANEAVQAAYLGKVA